MYKRKKWGFWHKPPHLELETLWVLCMCLYCHQPIHHISGLTQSHTYKKAISTVSLNTSQQHLYKNIVSAIVEVGWQAMDASVCAKKKIHRTHVNDKMLWMPSLLLTEIYRESRKFSHRSQESQSPTQNREPDESCTKLLKFSVVPNSFLASFILVRKHKGSTSAVFA